TRASSASLIGSAVAGSVDSAREINATHVRICDRPSSARSRAQLIPDRDLARFDYLGVHAAVGVPEAAQQRLGYREVARASVGIDVGGRATHDPLYDLEPRVLADRNLLAEQIELLPGRPALDIDVAAKAQRIDRRPDGRLES